MLTAKREGQMNLKFQISVSLLLLLYYNKKLNFLSNFFYFMH